MWKKALWVYIGLYILVIAGGIIYNAVVDISNGDFEAVALIFPLLMFIPAWILASELRGRSLPIPITIVGLLITAVPVVGIFNFNEMGLATIGKALLFVPMLAGLIYFGYMRLFRKR
jgi:hypothetical protein